MWAVPGNTSVWKLKAVTSISNRTAVAMQVVEQQSQSWILPPVSELCSTTSSSKMWFFTLRITIQTTQELKFPMKRSEHMETSHNLVPWKPVYRVYDESDFSQTLKTCYTSGPWWPLWLTEHCSPPALLCERTWFDRYNVTEGLALLPSMILGNSPDYPVFPFATSNCKIPDCNYWDNCVRESTRWCDPGQACMSENKGLQCLKP